MFGNQLSCEVPDLDSCASFALEIRLGAMETWQASSRRKGRGGCVLHVLETRKMKHWCSLMRVSGVWCSSGVFPRVGDNSTIAGVGAHSKFESALSDGHALPTFSALEISVENMHGISMTT